MSPQLVRRLIRNQGDFVQSVSGNDLGNGKAVGRNGVGSPLAQLLHALNQPLTGLQCSMEVALAGTRSAEQYVQGLHEGLELTARMRILVEAIREVVDGDGDRSEEKSEAIEWGGILREVVEELKPVAEAMKVGLTLDCTAKFSLGRKTTGRKLAAVIFRWIESVVSLATPGSAVAVETSSGWSGDWIRVRWQGSAPDDMLSHAALSHAEVGLLVAQAGWERVGAEWERERTENLEIVKVRLPGVSDSGAKF